MVQVLLYGHGTGTGYGDKTRENGPEKTISYNCS